MKETRAPLEFWVVSTSDECAVARLDAKVVRGKTIVVERTSASGYRQVVPIGETHASEVDALREVVRRLEKRAKIAREKLVDAKRALEDRKSRLREIKDNDEGAK